ncbi:MAG: IS1/IS1595 family N-terminal zinc-binding domain-containing protein [Thermoplasmatota archaeon]
MICPHCNSDEHVIKAGLRETQKGTIQRYRCGSCGKYFSDSKQKYSHYPVRVILYALQQYNKGYKGINSFSHSESIPRDTL